MAKDGVRALGLMSGTSMDGIDAAILETDGTGIGGFGQTRYRAYEDAERDLLKRAMASGADLKDRDERPGILKDAEEMVTAAHAAIVDDLVGEAGAVDVVGFHGQTVFHAPERHLTIQIGDGPGLAAACGVPVVYDFRARDVADGGEGAPLVPVYHQALAGHLGLGLPVAVINIGGVANATYIGRDGDLRACDTGPGNALMDDLIKKRTGRNFDEGGTLARQGKLDNDALRALLDNPYFGLGWPKSLDRYAFSSSPVDHLALEDAVATLAAFTASSIAKSLDALPERPVLVVVSGGGASNPVLVDRLAAETGLDVRTADQCGVAADFIEAQAFAFCAVRSLKGLPLTFPGTTGVSRPMPGGIRCDP